MAGDKRILIEVLVDAPRLGGADEVLAERLRAALLLNSSTSPEACARAQLLDHGRVGDRSGLAVGQPPRLLSELFETLARVEDVPPELLEREGTLTPADLRAAARVVAELLRACEYEGEGTSDAGQ